MRQTQRIYFPMGKSYFGFPSKQRKPCEQATMWFEAARSNQLVHLPWPGVGLRNNGPSFQDWAIGGSRFFPWVVANSLQALATEEPTASRFLGRLHVQIRNKASIEQNGLFCGFPLPLTLGNRLLELLLFASSFICLGRS